MRFRYLEEKAVYDDNDVVVGFNLIGASMGCGCCSEDYDITKELIEEHIAELEVALKEAKILKRKWFGRGAK